MMESVLAAINSPATLLLFLIGSGGLTTLLTAWIGWRQKRDDDNKTKEPALSVAFADRLAFERLANQVERVADLIEKAMSRDEMIRMIDSMRDKM
jgi:hypothetical protein